MEFNLTKASMDKKEQTWCHLKLHTTSFFGTKFTVVTSILGSRRWLNRQLWSPIHPLSILN